MVALLAGWLALPGGRPGADPEPAPLPGEAVAAVIAEREPISSSRWQETSSDGLTIPELRIDAPLVPASRKGPEVAVPDDPAVLGLSTSGAAPCSEEGTALVVGHVSSRGTKGALWPLVAVRSGTSLEVRCPDGSVGRYRASGSATATPKDRLDPGLDTATGPHRLVVVTCGGPVLPSGHYRDNVIAVFVRTP